jgi:hypothetical protein
MIMKNDPIVKEIRDIRLTMDKEWGPGSEEYFKHLMDLQKSLKKRLVRRQPKRLVKTPQSKI